MKLAAPTDYDINVVKACKYNKAYLLFSQSCIVISLLSLFLSLWIHKLGLSNKLPFQEAN